MSLLSNQLEIELALNQKQFSAFLLGYENFLLQMVIFFSERAFRLPPVFIANFKDLSSHLSSESKGLSTSQWNVLHFCMVLFRCENVGRQHDLGIWTFSHMNLVFFRPN